MSSSRKRKSTSESSAPRKRMKHESKPRKADNEKKRGYPLCDKQNLFQQELQKGKASLKTKNREQSIRLDQKNKEITILNQTLNQLSISKNIHHQLLILFSSFFDQIFVQLQQEIDPNSSPIVENTLRLLLEDIDKGFNQHSDHNHGTKMTNKIQSILQNRSQLIVSFIQQLKSNIQDPSMGDHCTSYIAGINPNLEKWNKILEHSLKKFNNEKKEQLSNIESLLTKIDNYKQDYNTLLREYSYTLEIKNKLEVEIKNNKNKPIVETNTTPKPENNSNNEEYKKKFKEKEKLLKLEIENLEKERNEYLKDLETTKKEYDELLVKYEDEKTGKNIILNKLNDSNLTKILNSTEKELLKTLQDYSKELMNEDKIFYKNEYIEKEKELKSINSKLRKEISMLKSKLLDNENENLIKNYQENNEIKKNIELNIENEKKMKNISNFIYDELQNKIKQIELLENEKNNILKIDDNIKIETNEKKDKQLAFLKNQLKNYQEKCMNHRMMEKEWLLNINKMKKNNDYLINKNHSIQSDLIKERNEKQIILNNCDKYKEKNKNLEKLLDIIKNEKELLNNNLNTIKTQLNETQTLNISLKKCFRQNDVALKNTKLKLKSKTNLLNDKMNDNASLLNKFNNLKNDKNNINVKNEQINIKYKNLKERYDKLNKLYNENLNNFINNNNDMNSNILKYQYNKVKAKLICSVCTERDKEVIIQSCGHMFCENCVDKQLSARNRNCAACNLKFSKSDVRSIVFS